MVKSSSLFGYVPSTKVQDNSNIRHLTKFKDNVQKAVDVNNALVQQIWHLKIQAAKSKSVPAQTLMLEEIDRLQRLLTASQAQAKIETAMEEVKEMELHLTQEGFGYQNMSM